jgi:C1A family cysteine protease
LPTSGSIKQYCTSIYDQGQLGSCTANAFCGAYRAMALQKSGSITFEPSRLYLYYAERAMEGQISADCGADVIDGESYVQKYGICSEKSWPYNIPNFKKKPPTACNKEALSHKISSYSVIPIDSNLLTNIKQAINNKTPVLIAIAVYDSFESETTAKTGVVTIPKCTEQSVGGHEMCIVGYTDKPKLFTVMNSWGSNWGKGGFCYIPYSYITNPDLAFEFTVFNL